MVPCGVRGPPVSVVTYEPAHRSTHVSALAGLQQRFRGVLGELSKFGTVGFIALGVELTVFNLALLALPDKPLTCKVFATLLSSTTAFLLNRQWSFRHRERSSLRREYALFAALNVVGLLISLSCLAVSHYVLGFESRLADNVAANGVGLVLGTAFRFWGYRRFVWQAPAAVREAADDGDGAARAALQGP